MEFLDPKFLYLAVIVTACTGQPIPSNRVGSASTADRPASPDSITSESPNGTYFDYRQSSLIRSVANDTDFPLCDSSNLDTAVFSRATGQFWICHNLAWQLFEGDLAGETVGPAGPQGPSGSVGISSSRQKFGGQLRIGTDHAPYDVSNGDYFFVTGVGNLMQLTAKKPGSRLLFRFDGTITISHDPSKIKLLGGGDYIAGINDLHEFVAEEDGSWSEVRRYGQNDSYVFASLADTSFVAGLTTSSTTVRFDEERQDTQNEYDPTTGVFTAQQSGYYEVIAQLNSGPINWGSGNSFQASLLKNSIAISSFRQTVWVGGITEVSQYLNHNLSLERGDTISIQVTASRASALYAASNNPEVYLIIRRMGDVL